MVNQDTVAFLRRVLPSQGWLCAAAPLKNGSRSWLQNTPHADIEALAAQLGMIDAAHSDAYMALASFRDRESPHSDPAKAKLGKTRFSRARENVLCLRSVWLDIDVKRDREDAYAVRFGALRAIVRFVRASGLPWPVVVDSGHGFHLYWPFSHDVDVDFWRKAATLLKAAVLGNGLKADHSCTLDAARVLRPVGTMNRKNPAKPVPVRLPYAGDGCTDAEFVERLMAAARPHLHLVRASDPGVNKANGAAAHTHTPDPLSIALTPTIPKAAEPIIAGCQQIREAAIQGEPVWRGMLSVIRLCVDGAEHCHRLSGADKKRYRREDIEAKLATLTQQQGASGMPATCAKFNGLRPGICDACPHWQKIRSPVVLGLDGPHAANDTGLELHAASITNENEPVRESDGDVIARLAALAPLDYDRVRRDAAKQLGCKAATLDELVAEARESEGDNNSPFRKVEPWPEPVDGAALLDGIVKTIRRFIVCDGPTAQAAALWLTMTWVINDVDIAPIAAISSPEKRCGKTSLLALIGRLARRPLIASNISPAALFRSVEMWTPTLLIDEADAFMRENEELRGLLNCGHTRDSAYVIRTVGEDFVPKQFSVWGAKAVAGIGRLADTLADRSITLALRRKLPDESAEKLRHAEPGLFAMLAAKLARWATDNGDAVRAARPVLPDSLNDRAADNWEPLAQIASVAGGEWPGVARRAALALSGDETQAQGISVELLADIREAFATRGVECISSRDLISELCRDEEAPWRTWAKGYPMTPKQFARMLAPYSIRSRQAKIDGANVRSYELEQFADAFERYLPESPDLSATRYRPMLAGVSR